MAYLKPKPLDLNEDFFAAYRISPGPVLGRGMSGEVVLIISPSNPSKKLAVKKLSLVTADGGIRSMRLFAKEIGAIQGLSHPHVIKHILSARCPGYLVICTEYCPNGTLSSRLSVMTPRLCTIYFLQMACAVRYLNDKQKLVHVDIKPSNIFIDSKNDAVLGDFGLSFFILPTDTVVPTRGMGGTPCFSAPEISSCRYVDPYKLDVYSLGVVLWCLIFMTEPTFNNVYESVQNNPVIFTIPQRVRWCLTSLLHPDPVSRPSITALLNKLHSLNFCRDLIDRLHSDLMYFRLPTSEADRSIFAKLKIHKADKPFSGRDTVEKFIKLLKFSDKLL